MSALGLIILGVILVIVAYYLPASAPPPLKTVLNIAGWICLAVGLILLLAGLLGLGPVLFGPVR